MNIGTLGTWDLFHSGHVAVFEECAKLRALHPDARVIVGVNTDGFVLRMKRRLPIMSYEERVACIKACRYVDEVDASPLDGAQCHSIKDWLMRHQVTTLVVGSDWLEGEYLKLVGLTQSDLQELGLTLIFKPYTAGISTTSLIGRIRQRHEPLPKKGDQTLAILPCYNPPAHLAAAVENLDAYVLVDNGSSECANYCGLRHPEVNQFGPTYEMGSLLHAFRNYEYPRYLTLQDSLILHDKRMLTEPDSLYEDAPKGAIYAFAPIEPASMHMTGANWDWIHEHFPGITDDEVHAATGVQYNCFSASREQIETMIDTGYLTEEKLARSKAGDEAWERILGVIFARLGFPVCFMARTSQTDHPVFTKHFMGRA